MFNKGNCPVPSQLPASHCSGKPFSNMRWCSALRRAFESTGIHHSEIKNKKESYLQDSVLLGFLRTAFQKTLCRK